MSETYIVKAGDTLYGISNQFGVSVIELANLNNVTADSLKVGQTLTIPSKSGTNPNNMFMYTVKKGDSLYSIATKYNTTVNEIVKLNNLTNTNLSIGQVLRIPETYTGMENMYLPEYTSYTVKRGDSLYTIAKNNNISVDTIKEDNGLTNNILTIGQVLKIRTKKGNNEVIEECFGEDYVPVSNDNYITYTVKNGDSLYKIANNYNTSVSDIQKLNNLTNINLSIGQVLKLPSTSNNSSQSTYTVKSGDSLYSIARKFNTTVDSIKNKNNLKSNLLTIGQKLII